MKHNLITEVCRFEIIMKTLEIVKSMLSKFVGSFNRIFVTFQYLYIKQICTY